MVCEVVKVPWVTSEQLKVFLTLADVNDHDVHQHQENTEQPWCTWQSCKKKASVLQKRLLLAKDHVEKPDDYWRKV